MRKAFLIAASLALSAQGFWISRPSVAAPIDFFEAQRAFDNDLTVDQRILAQILLIAAGYGNAVPMDHLTRPVMKALLGFEANNGFNPNGLLDRAQIDRLVLVGGAKLDSWGFQKVSYPGRAIAIWAPLGLGLGVMQNGSGLHFKDRQGRLALDMVSLPGKSVDGVYNGLLGDKQRNGWDIHYEVFKNSEGWFVVSATSPDGADHYYRYHRDGDSVTGFALEWNNAVENINAERIAVIMSGSLRAAMIGAAYIDPPASQAQASVPPEAQPAALPKEATPEPPRPKDMVSTGTAFFVSDDGYLVTNAHVVAECTKVIVKTDDGQVREASRTATDPTNDLAILKLDIAPGKGPKRVAALRLGARLGEGVETFGFPHTDLLSTSGNFTLGNVSALTGVKDDSRYLQVSAPVQAGNSGGPLLDGTGNLVGVVSAKLDAMKLAMNSGDLPQNVNFAVKSAVVATFLDANRVTYKTGLPGGPAMQPADIADTARAMSGFVMCR